MPGERPPFSEKTTIDGLPATQSAFYDHAPSRIYNGEPLGYMVHGHAHLDHLPADEGEPLRLPDGISRATVSFETRERTEESLRAAAIAAAFALEGLRLVASRGIDRPLQMRLEVPEPAEA